MQNLPVVPTGMGDSAPTHFLAVSDGWHAFREQARCHHPTSLYRLPANYVTGRREKPRRLACNSARGHDRDRCGPQARFWEARHYPPWVWMIGSVGAGLIIIIAYIAIAYIAFLRWVPPGVV